MRKRRGDVDAARVRRKRMGKKEKEGAIEK